MTSPIIDRGIIEILPDFTRFRTEYDAELASLNSRVKVNVDIDVDRNTATRKAEEASSIFSGSFKKGIAEAINALPFAGGLGANAATAIAGGIVAGAPVISAAVSAAVAGGVAAGGIATGILIAVQDPRIKQAGSELGASLKSSLADAAAPFTDQLLAVIPKIGTDVEKLKPQIAGLLTPLGPLLGRLEGGLLQAVQGTLPGITTAVNNSVQYVDALISKAPQIGAAFGQLLADLTSPAGVDFFKSIIDFADTAAVDVGKFIEYLDKMGQALHPLASIIGSVFGDALKLIGDVADGFGPKLTAVLALAGTAWVLFGTRVTTALRGVQIQAVETSAFLTKAQLSPIQANVANYSQTGSFGGGIGGGLNKFSLGAGAVGIGAVLAGSAIGGTGGTFLQDIGGGAATGAMIGGPVGAIVGGAIGTAIGVIQSAQNDLATSASKAADATKRMVDALNSYNKAAADKAARDAIDASKVTLGSPDIVKHVYPITGLAHDAGANVNELTQAYEGGSASLQTYIDKQKQQLTALEHSKNATSEQKRFLRDYIAGLEQLESTLPAATGDTNDNASAASKAAQAYAAASAGIAAWQQQLAQTPAALAQTALQPVDQLLQQYDTWQSDIQAVDKDQQQLADTITNVNKANIAAARAVQDAKDQIVAAHLQEQRAAEGLITAQKALQDAREAATKALRDQADTEEEASIRLAQAQRQELITRGLAPGNLERRQALVSLDEAQHALADTQEQGRTLRAQGVEGAPGVVAAKQQVLDAQKSIQDAHKATQKAIQNENDAEDNLNQTKKNGATQIQNERDALDQATKKRDADSVSLAENASKMGLNITQIQTLHGERDKLATAMNTALTLNPGNVPDVLNGIYDQMRSMLAAFGVTLPDLDALAKAQNPAPPEAGLINGWTPSKAAGGLIEGQYLGPAADNVVIRANPREYVQPVASVDHYGVDFMEAIRNRTFPKFAAGGLVLPLAGAIDPAAAPVFAQIAALKALGGTGANIATMQNWLRTVVDPEPYILGAVGPHAYDCSGLVGDVWAGLTGNKRNNRYFVTGNEGDFLRAHGFHRGPGMLTVGFNDHHTMGRLGGLNFEAQNPTAGIHVGSGTSDIMKFAEVMGLDNFPGAAPPPSAVTLKGAFGDALRNALTRAATQILSGGGDMGDPVDANVAQIAAGVGKQLGADHKAMLALFEAGLVESGMRNLNYGDRDSVGFLQQRPSQGWPDPMNVAVATRSFLARAMGIESRYGTAGRLAQGVQVSAFPDRYDQRQAEAQALLSRYGFDSGGWLDPGPLNGTGQREAVLTPEESAGLKAAVSNKPVRLDDYTIARLAQAIVNRPTSVEMDGKVVAENSKKAVADMLSQVM